MIILGIDPGVARVGWAVIETSGQTVTTQSFGCIETEKSLLQEHRLIKINKEVVNLCKKYHPDAMSVEELFFATNAKTAMQVGESRGVILLSAAQCRVPVVSYGPRTIKRAITGDGNADKKQMTTMVIRILKLRQIPRLDDTIDALAIAMTHAYSYKLKQHI